MLGSSLSSSQRAIEKHSLSPSVRAYSSPEGLRKDEDVDFLVIGVKAPLHRQALMPNLLNGNLKALFVEWPIDRTLDGTEEIARITKEQGIRTVVGMQGRYTAVSRRLAEIVNGGNGKIGKVLSTTVTGTVGSGDGSVEKKGVKFSLDPNSGATILCQTFALQSEVKSVSGLVKTMHATTSIADDATGEILEKEVPKRSPDQVLAQGTLKRTGQQPADDDIAWSLHMRGGTSLGGGLRWLIYGKRGEIEVTGPIGMIPQIHLPAPWRIRVKAGSAEEVEEEVVAEAEPGQPAVSRLWDAFLRGESSWPDFEHAVKIHRFVDAVRRSSAEGKVVKL